MAEFQKATLPLGELLENGIFCKAIAINTVLLLLVAFVAYARFRELNQFSYPKINQQK